MRIRVQAPEDQLHSFCAALNSGKVVREAMASAGIRATPEDGEYCFLVTCRAVSETQSDVLVMGGKGEFKGLSSQLLTPAQAGGRGELVVRLLHTRFKVLPPSVRVQPLPPAALLAVYRKVGSLNRKAVALEHLCGDIRLNESQMQG